jgi:hypothetical protein
MSYIGETDNAKTQITSSKFTLFCPIYQALRQNEPVLGAFGASSGQIRHAGQIEGIFCRNFEKSDLQ